MWLGQVITEHSRRTCDHETLVHRPCKSSISSIQNTMENSIEFFLNIHLEWALSLHDSMLIPGFSPIAWPILPICLAVLPTLFLVLDGYSSSKHRTSKHQTCMSRLLSRSSSSSASQPVIFYLALPLSLALSITPCISGYFVCSG